MSTYQLDVADEAFLAPCRTLDSLVTFLGSADAAALEHQQLEQRLSVDGRELLRQLLQAHLELRAKNEARLDEVIGADRLARTRVEHHGRLLTTVFGSVDVGRKVYRAPGCSNLKPADGALNLPSGQHSFGIRREVVEETTKGSYDDTVASVERHTGVVVGKRQVEAIAVAAAQDFDSFYESRAANEDRAGDEDSGLLVVSTDGKGIVMRQDSLRDATKKAAQARTGKLGKRLSKGEKRGCKRMATVAAVYSIAPFVRCPDDIMASPDERTQAPSPRPRPVGKRVWASVEKDAAEVIRETFEDAHSRDPERKHRWVGLVDGNNHQIDRFLAEAKRLGVELTLVVDFIHVLEYLWKAAWCFFEDGNPDAEAWVTERALAILHGKSSDVAAGIRRSATLQGFAKTDRKGVDACCDYLLAKRPYLRYDEFLAAGLPIATGVIEGACRHLVNDRMDITGARWGLQGAEAVLRLRSLRSSGDLDDYWCHHVRQEKHRNHEVRFAGGQIPQMEAA